MSKTREARLGHISGVKLCSSICRTIVRLRSGARFSSRTVLKRALFDRQISMNQGGGARWLVSLVMLAVWLAAFGWAAANSQGITDWWRLRNYQAPARVAQLAKQDTMTDLARKAFYVNQPELNEKTVFITVCPHNGGEQTIVLGCYHGNQGGIFLLVVDDTRLNGVEQVTAAHEMLHAAYDRLSGAERTKVDAMLKDYYANQLRDQRILDTIAAYKQSEPKDLVNEMHSVFGSEVTNLPAALEQYYNRYFTNRAQVAAFAAQYQEAFTSRQAQVAAYDAQLADLKTQIKTAELGLKTKQDDISNQQAALISLRNSGDTAAYNNGVPAYNSLVDAYNNEVARIKNLVGLYNRIVAARNAVALEQDQLSKKLDSSAAPIAR